MLICVDLDGTLLDTLTSVCSTLRLLGAFTLDSTEK